MHGNTCNGGQQQEGHYISYSCTLYVKTRRYSINSDKKRKKNFCGFSMDSNQYWVRKVYGLCLYFMTGEPECSTESGFMENLGIKPMTPDSQGIGLSPTPRRLRSFEAAVE